MRKIILADNAAMVTSNLNWSFDGCIITDELPIPVQGIIQKSGEDICYVITSSHELSAKINSQLRGERWNVIDTLKGRYPVLLAKGTKKGVALRIKIILQC